MKLITFTLMLGVLALASVCQAQAPNWDKYLKCARVGTTVVAGALRECVPEIRVFLNCINFNPPPNPNNSYLGTIKIIYEFLKRSVLEKTDCLLSPIKRGIVSLKPHVQQIDTLKCFDQ